MLTAIKFLHKHKRSITKIDRRRLYLGRTWVQWGRQVHFISRPMTLWVAPNQCPEKHLRSRNVARFFDQNEFIPFLKQSQNGQQQFILELFFNNQRRRRFCDVRSKRRFNSNVAITKCSFSSFESSNPVWVFVAFCLKNVLHQTCCSSWKPDFDALYKDH